MSKFGKERKMWLIQRKVLTASWKLLLDLWLGDREEMEKPRSRQGQQPQISSSPSSVLFLSLLQRPQSLSRNNRMSQCVWACEKVCVCPLVERAVYLPGCTASGGFPNSKGSFVWLVVCNVATETLQALSLSLSSMQWTVVCPHSSVPETKRFLSMGSHREAEKAFWVPSLCHYLVHVSLSVLLKEEAEYSQTVGWQLVVKTNWSPCQYSIGMVLISYDQ